MSRSASKAMIGIEPKDQTGKEKQVSTHTIPNLSQNHRGNGAFDLRSIRTFAGALALSVFGAAPALAELLTLVHNDKTIVLDEEDFAKLPQTTIETENEYIIGRATFTGVLLRDLLQMIDAQPSDMIIATALNDYVIRIPVEDSTKYDVVVAREMNGTKMRVRDYGPLWVMYPHDDLAAEDRNNVNSRLIWQLARLEIQD